jgi:hypothetical protein
MQIPNFPNEIIRVSLSAGNPGESPTATVTAIPARYNKATISTANSRRIALEKLGKIETIAESNSVHIVRTWVANREGIEEAVRNMHTFLQTRTLKKLEAIHKLQQGLQLEPIIRERAFEDD